MLFKPRAKNSIPARATRSTKRGVQYASWINRQNKKVTAEIHTDAEGDEYVYIECATWYARWKDSAGRRIQKNTECTDKSKAAAVLHKWRGRAESVKAGYIRAADEHVDKRKAHTVDGILAEYLVSLKQAGRTEKHVDYIKYVIGELKAQTKIHRIIDLTRRHIEIYLAYLRDEGKGARTRNMHKTLINGFCVYAVRHGYLESNPAANIESANQATDRLHIRRAMTDKEITKLLDAAERRPLDNFLNGNTGPVDTKKVKHGTLEELKRIGREHRLLYETLLTTAARWSELRAVIVADCILDSDTPHIRLKATATKNRRADTVPLTVDLADSLKTWIKDTGRMRKAKLFDMGESGLRTFKADLEYAGIPLKTDEGVLDIHALRHTAATRLARAGVPVSVAQRILRHSDPKLTMSLYAHLGVMDTTAAVEGLPPLRSKKAGNKKTA